MLYNTYVFDNNQAKGANVSLRMAQTCQLILAFLRDAGKPMKCSEIRKAITEQDPNIFYTAMYTLRQSGAIKRLNMMRDSKYAPGRLRFLEVK
jgi:Fe2+ or Zn2+ uptake regulation protein